MSPTLVTVDREIVEISFREWQEEQSLLDAQLVESLAALESYQAHLDSWQQDLVREREELRQLRESQSREPGTGGDELQQLAQLDQELRESREKIASLTAALAAAQSAGAASHHQAAFERAVEQAASAEHGAGKVSRGGSPVLGSVMEQFGKLREQRSLNRANNKTH
jgi:peptidoglycan hydrolase CwlO-like protein